MSLNYFVQKDTLFLLETLEDCVCIDREELLCFFFVVDSLFHLFDLILQEASLWKQK